MSAAHVIEPEDLPAPKAASIVPLPRRARPLASRLAAAGRGVAETGVPPLIVLLTVGMVWEVMAQSNPQGLPGPSAIWRDSRPIILDPFFDNGGVDKGLFWHVATSLSRVGLGFSLAAVCGVALGVLVGASKWAHRGLDPIFQVLRTVPPLAWLPISLAALREAQPSALFVIFITSIWPIIINTAVGVRNIPDDYNNVSRVLRLSPLEHFAKVILPATTPYIFTGLRIGIGMSWLAIVASEMLLGGVGVGFFIWDQYNSSRISDIVVALIWVGLVGFALDRLVALVGRLVSRGTAVS
ncbi:nitrate ABC transporter permease [Phenylobacterium sp.]|jgi:nitrate/nitrite transport system permease protein|uniref:nitrate ABC transporter permease n=1 Tax=Phenylobacterium sp. TaxID=1871053 RepID=UPI002E359EA0|nr:nitrate ABC transporter permease [Phenylobacterium sp.]HEX2561631.1 nitrate ABC transporter permease [Phenylobacterium sp.]